MAVRISAIIPAYNRARTIGRAIESVLEQKLRSLAGADELFEIIIVDDGSTDDLAGALRRFNGPLRLIRHERNSGAAAARNTAVAAAEGEFVAFLDSDDIWLPGKLSRQVSEMLQRGWAASCTAYLLAKHGSSDFVSPRFVTGALDLQHMVWGCFVSPGSTLVCHRSLFEDIGPFDTNFRRLEDWDWLLRLVRSHALGFLAEPLARIQPSAGGGVDKVIPAVERMWQKHAAELDPRMRRRFAAALDVERASAFYRAGNFSAAAVTLSRSLLRAPLRNGAIAAILHNRLARQA